MRETAKRLIWQAVPAIYPHVQRRVEQEFAVGIAVGASPLAMGLASNMHNPAVTRRDVTDVPATLVADPFMCRDGGRWCMFMEVGNHLTQRGEIGLAISSDALTWKYEQIVLAEPFHMSYPHVFQWLGSHFMIPEIARARAVRLYKATEFPYAWQHVENLLEGGRFADSSILHYHGRWWLFTDGSEDATDPLLRLFLADTPLGPWHEHPASPICRANPHITRPGGKLVVLDDIPVRFAQDIYPQYGSRVFAFAITKLTPTEYEEHAVSTRAVLDAGPYPWCAAGMHHIDAHLRPDGSWIACVDGFSQAASAAA